MYKNSSNGSGGELARCESPVQVEGHEIAAWTIHCHSGPSVTKLRACFCSVEVRFWE